MKTLILTLSFLLGMNLATAANYPTKQITQYTLAQKQTIALPTNFAKPFIIDQNEIDLLAGKTIHHVELIYTEYAQSSTFNQTALNNQRISQLKQLLPQINSDNPSWTLLEQTGAKSREVAHTYFHGFVIHYGDKLDHSKLGDFFSEVAAKSKEFKVDVASGGTFTNSSGTKIHVPTNAVVDKSGRAITGQYTLYYTEYRNSAEIALSGLPMLYKGDNFSSIGMYEIRGEKDGKELKLKKPITIDFNCTKIVDDAAFFSMDDRTGTWKKEHDLAFENQTNKAPSTDVNVIESQINFTDNTAPYLAKYQGFKSDKIDDKTMLTVLDKKKWKAYEELEESDKSLGVISKNSKERSVIVQTGKLVEFQRKVLGLPVYSVETDEFWGTQTLVETKKGTVKRTKMASDAGHTFPTIVSGLQSRNFGVYNCDQVYRMKEVARLNPLYRDSDSNEEINNGFVACVIDLTKNGSFSFHPNHLTVNKRGRTAVLLFTKEKEIYLIDENAFAQLELTRSQNVTMSMKNVTEQLKSPADLKKMLNI